MAAHAQSSGPVERQYPLADRGSLVLWVPSEWREQTNRRDPKLPYTIRYQAKSGAPFDILVTPIWPMKPGIAAPTDDELRRAVSKAADDVKAQAVETVIVPNELLGVAVKGYYFKVTDRAPKKDEFKYMAQGMLGLGDLRMTFTILTNDGQEAVVEQAFSMLRRARVVAPGAKQ